MPEVWKDIAGYEGLYEVSSLGTVRSLDRNVNYCNGVTRNHIGSIRIPVESNQGYLMVTLHKKGARKTISIHRIVAVAFVKNENPEHFSVVNHKDLNSKNNAFDNLEWTSQRSNVLHARSFGSLHAYVIESHRKKLTAASVSDIRKRLHSGEKQKHIAAIHGVCRATILSIKKGKTWPIEFSDFSPPQSISANL